MPDAPSITDAEWEVHKKVIGRLYQDKPLHEVMSLMEQDHGFVAKKSQYVRKLKYWNFSKYATSETWAYVAQKLEKRKQEGKDSETYLNGKLIPIKKVRKEISRYPLSSYYYGAPDTASSPQPPPGVEVCTPLGGGWSPRFVDYLHIPWFEFEVLIRPHAEFMWREDHQQHNAFTTWDCSSLPGHPDIYNINSFTSHMPVPGQQSSFHNIQGTCQTDFALNFSGKDSMQYLDPPIEAADEPQISPTPQSSIEEARSIFAEIIGDPYASSSEDVISAITSRLDGFLPERQNGELVRSVKRIFDLSSIADASLQLLHYAVFLSSNNLLRSSQIDKLLKWMIKMHQSSLIERLIRIKTPTVEIFLSHLLNSATRLREIDIVLAVLAHGVDVNALAGDISKTTALYEATAIRDVHLVRLLLNAGANPNANFTSSLNESPMQKSVQSMNNHELVQMLLDAGGDANVAPLGIWIPDTLLTFAAKSCDITLVRMLLKSNADVNMMTKSSTTALQAAASANDVEIVQILLDSGADIDAPSGNRYETARMTATEGRRYMHLVSSIQFAAYNDNIEMVQILLDLNANVDGYILGNKFLEDNDEDERDLTYLQTPLQHAVSNRNHILVRLLLLAGADANSHQYGDSPLQIAARENDVTLVQLLVRKGAHVNAAANENGGRTALQSAAFAGNSDLVQRLLDEGADVHALPASKNGRTAIQAAAEGGHTEILRTLRNLGADINSEPSPTGGRTCLQAAAENSHTEMIRLLLKFGADVNAPATNEMGRTALQAAIEGNDSASVDILLDAGADINAAPSLLKGVSALYSAIRQNNSMLARRLLVTANPDGPTGSFPPIVKAAQHGNFDLVQSLIEAGADVNALGTQFALQAAVKCGDIKVIHILLEAQAQVNACTTAHPLRPLELAIRENHSDIVRLLLANGVRVNPEPSVKSPATIALGEALDRILVNEDIISDLIVAGADVNRGSTRHGLPLSGAAKDFHLTRRLLDAGADVNGQWLDQPTALQRACSGQNIDIIKLLLDSGADINAPASPKGGKTALQAAMQHGKTQIINLLLQHGADCNALAAKSYGATALQFAAMAGRISIVLLLLRAGAEINAAPSSTGGRTALEAAAEHGRLDVMFLLLKNDTDVDGLDARCQRAARLAAANGHSIIAKLLEEYKRENTKQKAKQGPGEEA